MSDKTPYAENTYRFCETCGEETRWVCCLRCNGHGDVAHFDSDMDVERCVCQSCDGAGEVEVCRCDYDED